MKKIFTFSFLFLLLALTTRAQLVLPNFSSADNSNETWYYIRFKRQAVNNLVWTTDFPTTTVIKQLSKAGTAEERKAQQWKLVGNRDAFYIENNLTNFKVAYAATEDVEKSIRGTNYIVDAEGGPGSAALKLDEALNGRIGGLTSGNNGWIIINPEVNNPYGYINDRASNSTYPWRDLCYYYYVDDGCIIEFVDASTQTIVVATDSLAQEARISHTGKATFSGIDNFNIEGNITATIEGDDAAAFGFSEGDNIVENGKGSLYITFSPTEARVYNATLVLSGGNAPDVRVRLIGDGYEAVNLPQFSDENNEHWYYIQFHRKAAANTVWSLSDTTLMIVQDTLRPGVERDDQQWKITGNWETGYSFVNKVREQEIVYNATASDDGTRPANRYLKVDEGLGDVFNFVRYKQSGELTTDWQLFNLDATTTNKYINDDIGKHLCNWSPNSDGDRLLFIPADQPNIMVASTPLTFETRTGTDTVKSLSIVGLNLTTEIAAEISGDDASAFSLDFNGLPATGRTLRITFSPVATKAHTATLTLRSGGVTKSISLTGNSDLGLPEFSTDGNEVWYYVQFVRQDRSESEGGANRVWTVVPTEIGENTIPQIFSKQLEEENFAQHWKITGEWEDGYKIISRNGGEMLLDDVNPSEEVSLRIVLKPDFGDKFLFKGRSTTAGVNLGKWQLQIVGKLDGDKDYLNDYGGGNNENPLGLWSVNDLGAYINFIPVSSWNAIDVPSLDPNDAVVAVKYYTLLGHEVVRPATTGVYIVRSTYASGKIQATKQLFIIK